MNYFYQLMADKKIKKNHNKDPDAITEPDFSIDEDKTEDDITRKDGKMELMQIKSEKPKVESMVQNCIDNIDLTIEPETPPKYYYYRRWLWMIFPWVILLSINNNRYA